MKNIIGRKIRDLREDAGLSQEELAEKLGVNRRTVNLWEQGKHLTEKNLTRIAKFFNKTIEYFYNPIPTSHINDTVNFHDVHRLDDNTTYLKVYTSIPCGTPDYNNNEEPRGTAELPKFILPKADYLVSCIGKSMEPEIPEGSYCIIRKEINPLNNKIMLLQTDEGYTIKKLVKKNNDYELHPMNDKYHIVKPKDLIVKGEVVGIVKVF